MTDFRFRLESVLRLRIRERDQRREELAAALQAETILQQQMQTLLQEIDSVRNDVAEAGKPGTVLVDKLLHGHRHRLLLRAQMDQLRQKQRQVMQEIERRRASLVIADQQVKLLEKLKQKAADQHRQWLSKTENKQLDEVAVNLWNREHMA